MQISGRTLWLLRIKYRCASVCNYSVKSVHCKIYTGQNTGRGSVC